MTIEQNQDYEGRWIPEGLSARRLDFDELPVIDFALMEGNDPAGKRRFAAALRRACVDIGFFYLKNHGVPQPLIDRAFALSRSFFALPLDEKMAIENIRTPGYGGYSPTRESTGGVRGRPLQEGFTMNLELPLNDPYVTGRRPFYHPNSWPANPAGFRAGMLDYFAAMRALGHKLFGAFALALDLPEDYFEPMIRKPMNLLRVNHYMPQPHPKENEPIGGRPHTDPECFTILAQEDGITALQVVNRRGEWISVPPLPGTFVVNIADAMAHWTNDLFASTMHRVVNKNERDRMSIAFFFATDDEVIMSALPNCVGPGEPPKYVPIRASDYVLQRLDKSYDNSLSKRS